MPDGNGNPPPGGKKKKRVWWKDPTTLTIAGVGAGAGLLVMMNRRGGPAGAGEAVGTPTGEGATAAGLGGVPTYSSVGQDLYNAVQDSTETLREQLATLQSGLAETNLAIGKFPTTLQPGIPGLRYSQVKAQESITSKARRHGMSIADFIRLNPQYRGKSPRTIVRKGSYVTVY
jgi:hypothetical protein